MAVAGFRRAWVVVGHGGLAGSGGPSLESGLRLRRRFGLALTLLRSCRSGLTVPRSRLLGFEASLYAASRRLQVGE